MKKLIVFFLLLFVAAYTWGAASSVTQRYYHLPGKSGVRVLEYTWVTSASQVTAMATSESANRIDGWVFMVITDPGMPSPTDNYDILLLDDDRIDITGGELQDRDYATSEAVPYMNLGSVYGNRFVRGTLTFHMSGHTAASTATGVVSVFIED